MSRQPVSADAEAEARANRPTEPPLGLQKRRRDLLDQLIEDYARRTETGLVWARLVVLSIGLLQVLELQVHVGLAPARLGVTAAIYSAALLILALIKRLLTHHLRTALSISILLDPLCVFALFLAAVLWPDSNYRGVMYSIDVAVLPLAMVAAGCRYHRDLALRGIWLGFGCGVALVLLDVRINSAVSYGLSDLIAGALLMVAAAILSLLIADRSRRVAFDAARLAIKNERAREKLRVYVSEQVAHDVLDSSDDEIALDGQLRHVAVLFCDLRDFTRYSNAVEPNRLVRQLNAYFEAVVPAIHVHSGMVDKFIGDAIMCVFSRQEGVPPPAARALAAARDMHRCLDKHNSERAAHELPPLRHGIGIHAGWVVAGNVGTADRKQYTVIGDVVNLAARLERATKERDTWLLMSEPAWREAQAAQGDLPALAAIDPLALRGVDGPIEAFAPAPVDQAAPAQAAGEPG